MLRRLEFHQSKNGCRIHSRVSREPFHPPVAQSKENSKCSQGRRMAHRILRPAGFILEFSNELRFLSFHLQGAVRSHDA